MHLPPPLPVWGLGSACLSYIRDLHTTSADIVTGATNPGERGQEVLLGGSDWEEATLKGVPVPLPKETKHSVGNSRAWPPRGMRILRAWEGNRQS